MINNNRLGSKCRGLYRSLLGWISWDGSSWLFPKFWLEGYPSLVMKFLDFQNFNWSFSRYIGSTRNVNLILRLFIGVLLSLVGRCDFSTIIYWQVRIFTCPPRFLKRGQDESCGTFQKLSFVLSIFCLSAISLLLEVAGNTNVHVLR